MPRPNIITIGDSLYWSYANLAMAHAAVSEGAKNYQRQHFIVRSRLHSGLLKGTMNIGSILDDERLKLKLPQACYYCGGRDKLSMDHLVARKRGGPDCGDNLTWACRSCNSSKGASDFLEWMHKRGEFPPLLLLRRYLKLSIGFCEDKEIMDTALAQVDSLSYPLVFSIHLIPHKYPGPSELKLWVLPLEEADE